MNIDRLYTRPGVSPYSYFEYEQRSSVLKNLDGSVVYSNDTVIVPTTWSPSSSDILAQKYFRKTGVNHTHKNSLLHSQYTKRWAETLTPEVPIDPDCCYEFDIRQVVHRIAGCWAFWGKNKGYFKKDQDQVFYDEVVYMLLNQMMAPNSPQWFNTGLHWAYGYDAPAVGHYYVTDAGDLVSSETSYEHPQSSACFILSVEDNLVGEDGIYDLAAREARIFKYGSGSGVNYSKLRGRDEPLSGGGKSSGPMSFVKILDAGAGAVKSGGTTRRAARMFVLDADHPDVEEFISWKVYEEQKVVALVTGSRMMQQFWSDLRQAPESGRKQIIAKAKAQGVPLVFVSQCLDRIKNGDTTADLKVYDFNWEGDAYHSVCGMNANNSVRITDAFMQAVEDDSNWDLKARTTGETTKTLKARDLFNRINQAAWMCADPGVQFDTTTNAWHTCSDTSRINASNPCAEYLFVDDSACNLASLNLVKFLDFLNDSSNTFKFFNIDSFKHACNLTTIALDITVAMSQYPSAKVAQNVHNTRPLGLGFANLGSLLMRMGYAYDSAEARYTAACISAIMTGQGYLTSAEMAQHLGTFALYDANKKAMLQVMHKHAKLLVTNSKKSNDCDVDTPHPRVLSTSQEAKDVGVYLFTGAREVWDSCLKLGKQHGYRNAQLTALAPTGTIGFIMGCDTTGIEPSYTLIAYKKLSGGGYMKLVNQSVTSALTRLHYPVNQIYEIVSHIDAHGTIEGSTVKAEHLPVFDCANKCGDGSRSISWTGHVDMMAACQGFISGGISKTVNLPSSASIDDIGFLHSYAWKVGLKSIAIYRDGSKFSQALASNMELLNGLDPEEQATLVDSDATTNAKISVLASAMTRNYRKRLDDCCGGFRQRAKVGGHSMYVHTGEYENGSLGEIFIDVSREGATLRSMFNCFAIAISLGLQYGVPLEEFVEAFVFTKFEPSGMVQGSRCVKSATSLLDYIFRELAIKYLGRHELAHIKPEVPVEVTASGKPAKATPKPILSVAEEAIKQGYTGGICTVCGSIRMVRTGTCSACQECGTSSGCS